MTTHGVCAFSRRAARLDRHSPPSGSHSPLRGISVYPLQTPYRDGTTHVVLGAARVLHHAITLNIRGSSYRLKEKLKAGLVRAEEPSAMN